MKLILLSGGSGKRLWPLSNDQRSKQFIKVLRNGDKLESMVQRVWRQLESVDLTRDTFIATGESQLSILKNQLGISDAQIITEPCRRDTFPAIALSCSYLYSVIGAQENEMIVVLPVDPYVDIEFFKKIKELENLLNDERATLGLVGIEPTFPSEKYGYIVPESGLSTRVLRFQEKPKRHVAKNLISEGAVWNAGVFGFKLSTILDLLRNMGITTNFQELSRNYDLLPKNSFDYEFTEKQNDIAFIRYEGYWKDLGTWNTLTEEMDTRTIGFSTEVIDAENTHVINDSSLPIAVIGAKDLIVAAGPEGVLVSTKDESPRVKELSSNFFKSINYVEESWGCYYTLYETQKSNVIRYKIFDDKVLELCLNTNQTLLRLSGVGKVTKSKKKFVVKGLKDFNFVVITEEK